MQLPNASNCMHVPYNGKVWRVDSLVILQFFDHLVKESLVDDYISQKIINCKC